MPKCITIATVLLLHLLLTFGCSNAPSGARVSQAPFSSNVRTQIVTIEDCEYLFVESGMLDQYSMSLTHKGNCKNPIHNVSKE